MIFNARNLSDLSEDACDYVGGSFIPCIRGSDPFEGIGFRAVVVWERVY